jgi:hypothetical protein
MIVAGGCRRERKRPGVAQPYNTKHASGISPLACMVTDVRTLYTVYHMQAVVWYTYTSPTGMWYRYTVYHMPDIIALQKVPQCSMKVVQRTTGTG